MYFPLCRLIQSRAGIPINDISSQVEIVRGKARFDIIRERGRETVIYVIWYWDEVSPAFTRVIESLRMLAGISDWRGEI